MELKEFLLLRDSSLYDFSNDGAGAEYTKLDNVQNPYSRFFSYKASGYQDTRDDCRVMKYSADFSSDCIKKFGKIPDPDSGSPLLQEIYHALWDEKYLNICRKADSISGETLFSQGKTLCTLYEDHLETPDEKCERKAIRDPRQDVSIRYMIGRYAEQEKECADRLDSVRGLRRMLAVYHTLGNFLPFPVDCNSQRGIGNTKDYPDIMLYIIYRYYIRQEDRLADIIRNSAACTSFRSWLDLFGEKAAGWNRFIQANFLDDFVCRDAHGYGIPIELWQGHFENGVMPGTKSQIESFYVNGASMIAARTGRMLTALQENVLRKPASHAMKLQPAPFAMIRSGRKTIELRLNDEKRRSIRIGDTIVFTEAVTGETLCAKVEALHRFDSFAALYRSLPLLKCGYTEDTVSDAGPSDMEQYYSAEEQEKYGVVGIEIAVTD